jgi:hypothetical protein
MGAGRSAEEVASLLDAQIGPVHAEFLLRNQQVTINSRGSSTA